MCCTVQCSFNDCNTLYVCVCACGVGCLNVYCMLVVVLFIVVNSEALCLYMSDLVFVLNIITPHRD